MNKNKIIITTILIGVFILIFVIFITLSASHPSSQSKDIENDNVKNYTTNKSQILFDNIEGGEISTYDNFATSSSWTNTTGLKNLGLLNGKNYGSPSSYSWNNKTLIYRPFIELPFTENNANRESSAPFFEFEEGILRSGLNFYLEDENNNFSLIHTDSWIFQGIGDLPTWPDFEEGRHGGLVKIKTMAGDIAVGFKKQIFFNLVNNKAISVNESIHIAGPLETKINFDGKLYALNIKTQGKCPGYNEGKPNGTFSYTGLTLSPVNTKNNSKAVSLDFSNQIDTLCQNDEFNSKKPSINLVGFTPDLNYENLLFSVTTELYQPKKVLTQDYYKVNSSSITKITEDIYDREAAFLQE